MNRATYLFLALFLIPFSVHADMGSTEDFASWDAELSESWNELDEITESSAAANVSSGDVSSTPASTYVPPAQTSAAPPVVQRSSYKKMIKPQAQAVAAKPLAYEEDSIDSRQLADAKGRTDRLETRIKQLERDQRVLSDQVRQLDRTVNELQRKR